MSDALDERHPAPQKAAQVALDRKIIAEIAATDTAAFSELVKVAQTALKSKMAALKP